MLLLRPQFPFDSPGDLAGPAFEPIPDRSRVEQEIARKLGDGRCANPPTVYWMRDAVLIFSPGGGMSCPEGMIEALTGRRVVASVREDSDAEVPFALYQLDRP